MSLLDVSIQLATAGLTHEFVVASGNDGSLKKQAKLALDAFDESKVLEVSDDDELSGAALMEAIKQTTKLAKLDPSLDVRKFGGDEAKYREAVKQAAGI